MLADTDNINELIISDADKGVLNTNITKPDFSGFPVARYCIADKRLSQLLTGEKNIFQLSLRLIRNSEV